MRPASRDPGAGAADHAHHVHLDDVDIDHLDPDHHPDHVPGSAGSRYVPLIPARIEDTRTGAGGLAGAIGPGATVAGQVAAAGECRPTRRRSS